MMILEWLLDKQRELLALFSPVCDKKDPNAPRPYPSLITALFRLCVLYIHFILPVIWVICLILCIIEALPFLGVILVSVLAAVLATGGLFLLFLVLMAIESFARILTSLIERGILPAGFENPVDAFISGIFRGDLF